ncbi:MAG: dimethylsulfoniopropionate demethylase [Pseudomonadota bacterium]
MTALTTTMPLTVRMRRSPFFARSHAAGARSYIVYNNMLIATHFEGAEADYRHLKRGVQLWDVGCERQIEIAGPDAARLVQLSTPRDIRRMADDQCYYIPTVDGDGHMTNDPVLVKVDAGRYWVSIADSDQILFYKGVAAALNLNVRVFEPAVSPLGIQGPNADALVGRVFGEAATKVRFFRHVRVDVDGTPMVLARSGYSLQGGYELYFEGEDGSALWDRLMDAGEGLDVRAGSPCQAERVEGGLLSYLSDITDDMTPFEAGLGRFCDIDTDTDTGCLGLAALRAKREPTRQVRPLRIDGPPVPPMGTFWPITTPAGEPAGRVSSCTWSWSFEQNVAIALVDRAHWDAGTALRVVTPDGERSAEVLARFPGRG